MLLAFAAQNDCYTYIEWQHISQLDHFDLVELVAIQEQTSLQASVISTQAFGVAGLRTVHSRDCPALQYQHIDHTNERIMWKSLHMINNIRMVRIMPEFAGTALAF